MLKTPSSNLIPPLTNNAETASIAAPESESKTFGENSNPTKSVHSTDVKLGEFPVYATIIIVSVIFIMTTTFFYFLCRCLSRRKKRENQLASLTPKLPKIDPRMAGVRASHTIEFVVPSFVTLSENTEESVSETDYSSGGAKSLPNLLENRRKRKSGFHINPEDLQHGLYVGVTEKKSFNGDLGKVGFSMRYNHQKNQLVVRIIGAKNLPCHFLKTTANPCVKVVLLPDRTAKYMTKVQKGTKNPLFNESFVFPVRRDELQDKKLKISVWDYDRFSRKCLIGQVVYSIKDSGLTNSFSVEPATGEIWVDLKQESSKNSTNTEGVTEMLLSLCYDPVSCMLTLTVLKVRGVNIQTDKGKETSLYAKVTLYVRRKLVRTKKTCSRKKAPEIEFGYPFSIHVPQGALKDVDLMVALCEKWSLGKRVLGRTQVGPNCLCEQGLQHWQDMLASSKSTCAQWHTLYS